MQLTNHSFNESREVTLWNDFSATGVTPHVFCFGNTLVRLAISLASPPLEMPRAREFVSRSRSIIECETDGFSAGYWVRGLNGPAANKFSNTME